VIANTVDLASRISILEDAILARLAAGALQVRDIDIEKLKAGVAHPAVYISTETGTFTKKGQEVYACELHQFLVLLFHNVKDERARRRGLYPILEGVAQLLMGQTLGLDITPIKPVRFRNVTSEAFRKQYLCAYELELTATVELRKEESQGDAGELLRIGLEYYLQDPADDGRADATDLMDLKEGS